MNQTSAHSRLAAVSLSIMNCGAASRIVRLASVLVIAFIGARLGNATREARADNLSAASIYVPPAGLAFRASEDGKLIARLSRDAHGAAVFVLYDAKQEPALRIPAGAMETTCSPDDMYTDSPDPFVGRDGFRSTIDPRCAPRSPGPGF